MPTPSPDAALAVPAAAPRPAAAGAPSLAVAVVEDERGLDALEPEWSALLERSDASVFQSFEWLRTWWRHFGEGRPGARLHVVTVRGEGGLVAIAPLYVQRVRLIGLAPFRRLLFLGHRDSDYLDVLAARGLEEPAADAVAAALAGRRRLFDVAILEETPEGSRAGPLLAAALARRGFRVSRAPDSPCPRTALARTWEETLARFGQSDRREVRRRLRNLQKEHRVELELVPAGDGVVPAMREFVEMHQERWARDGWWGAFADPAAAEFHVEVAERLAGRGWLFLAFLRVDGRRLVVNYGFSFRDAVAVYLPGAREVPPALARHSPGRVLHALGMQWAIAQGRTVYDFMRGAEAYKYEFDAVDVPNWRVVAYPARPRLAAAAHAVQRALATVRRRLRNEAHALRVARGGAGWASPAVRAHLARAFRRGVRDVRRVLRRGRRA
ncbi:MAG TPA: GNAT family N-acetyltransferase [Anaeromyxobacter sp.]|nr:GNAT family N-acetyltransferase [Anaeromyxobacter sp.]